ncbi:dihydroorotase [Paracoccaceae bacterium]|nr:dihydroorotase [Paracoccaceae bacterium]
MEKTYLDILKPDDWHVHLREGVVLSRVLPFTCDNFGSALVMPNLDNPVTNISLAETYYAEICKQIPKRMKFTPHMTLYLTNCLTKDEIKKVSTHPYIKAIKMYPRGATTNSESGISNIMEFYPLFEAMEKNGVILSIHGEVTDENVDVFEREKVFIERILTKIINNFPNLKVVLEHITSADAVKFVEKHKNIGATITNHHLMVNRNIMLSKGIRPDFYCAPILKTEYDRLALVQAAISGNDKFFLGTDSAPHVNGKKITTCGCAGIFSSPLAVPLLIQLFEEHNSLEKIEKFMSKNGRAFYGVEQQLDRVQYVKRSKSIKPIKDIKTDLGKITVFNPYANLYWERAN